MAAFHGDPIDFGRHHIQHISCPCNTVSDFPQPCPVHGTGWAHRTAAPAVPSVPMIPGTYRFTLNPGPQRLSDEDVERIARRVADLLREPRE